MKKSSNTQTIVEKIEILDESTGQIILKQRTRTINSDNQILRCDEDDDLNEFDNVISYTEADDNETCTISYPHATILSKLNASQLEPIEIQVSSPDGKGSFFRCPLCPIQNAYYNAQANKVVDHLNGNKHFGIAVKHHGWLICKCDDTTCDTKNATTTNGGGDTSDVSKFKAHRHCPHCGRTINRRNEFIFHIERCCPISLATSNGTRPQQVQPNQLPCNTNIVSKKILNVNNAAKQNSDEKIPSSPVPVVTTPSPLPSTSNTQIPTTSNATYIYVINSPTPATAAATSTTTSTSTTTTVNSSLHNYGTSSNKRKLIETDDEEDEEDVDSEEIEVVNRNLTNKSAKTASKSSSSVANDVRYAILTDNDAQNNNNNNDNKITIEYIDELSSTSSNSNAAHINVPQSAIIISKPSITNGVAASSSTNINSNNTASNTISSTSGLSAHIVQNYSILAHEITAPLDSDIELKTWHPKPVAYQTNKSANSSRAQKDVATCQFCGRAMLKKNIPTHIRRAHTPKEELVCINEEQNIFTLQHLKPGQRRKRSARAYDYSLMTATISIDEDPCEGIENKFITEGEEILSTDLLQLADRIKFGISQIPTTTLTKLIDILTKIEYSTTDEICSNAKTIKNMIVLYLTSNEEYKYKIKQIGDEISEKKKQVNSLRADLKEVMTRKAQLERRIQPIICELQKLEDQHGGLIDQLMQLNGLIHLEIIHDDEQQTGSNEEEDESQSQIVC